MKRGIHLPSCRCIHKKFQKWGVHRLGQTPAFQKPLGTWKLLKAQIGWSQGSSREESRWHSQEGAALGAHGPAYQLLVPGTIRRVTEVIKLFYPRAAQQAGTLVGEGVKGELAVIPAHPTVACKDPERECEDNTRVPLLASLGSSKLARELREGQDNQIMI